MNIYNQKYFESNRPRWALGLVLLAGLSTALWGGEISGAEEARISPVRRTTIMTADPEASLKFYRDTLGFTVEYDKIIESPNELSLVAPGAKKARVIALRQGAKLGGSVGLSWFDTLKPRPQTTKDGSCDQSPVAGAPSLLFLTDNLQGIYAKLRAINAPVLATPVAYDQNRGPTDAFTVFDPNCVRVAFAQIQKEVFDQSIEK